MRPLTRHNAGETKIIGFGWVNERFGELGGRMTLIKFSDPHVFEALLAKGPNGLDNLHQVFPRVGTARGGGLFLTQKERGRPGSGKHGFSLIISRTSHLPL